MIVKLVCVYIVCVCEGQETTSVCSSDAIHFFFEIRRFDWLAREPRNPVWFPWDYKYVSSHLATFFLDLNVYIFQSQIFLSRQELVWVVTQPPTIGIHCKIFVFDFFVLFETGSCFMAQAWPLTKILLF